MSYARLAALASAVVLGFALDVRAQEPSKDGADPATASPSDPRSSLPSAPGRPGGDGAAQSSPSQQTEPKTDDTPTNAAQRREPIAPDARVIQFSFATQPWEYVLDWISELAGMSLQMEVKPQGTFSYINDPKMYTLGEALDIINAQLVSKGHILLRKGNYLKVLAFKDGGGIPPDLIRRIQPEDLNTCGESEYVSVILPLKNVSAKIAAEEVKVFSSEVGGKLTPLETVNRLMITDLVANIRLMRDYLKQIDEAGDGLQSRHRVFQLKFAPAAKVEAMLRDLFGLPPRQTAAATSSQRSSGSDRGSDDWRDRMRRMFEGGGGGGPPPFAMMFGQGGDSRGGDPRGDSRGGDERRGSDSRSSPTTATAITLAVDEAHNQILVMAPPDKLAIVEEFVKQVDVPRPGEDPFKPREPQTPTVIPYRLSDGDAQSLTTALQAIFQNTPGVRFSADQTNNMVIAVATPDDQRQIAKLVEQFEHDERDSVVLPLQVLDATSVAELLGTVYSSGQRDWRGNQVPRPGQPRVVADRTRNQLMLRGSKKQVEDIRSMLAALGEPTLSPLADNETIRIIPLNGIDPMRIEDVVRRVWSARPNNNPIEIIDVGRRSRSDQQPPANGRPLSEPTDDPSRRGVPLLTPRDSETEESAPARTPSSESVPGRTSRNTRTPLSLVSYTSAQRPQETDAAAPPRRSAEIAQDDKQTTPVVVSVGDDSVVISSTDTEALKRLANIIETLTRGGTPNTGTMYRVFELNSSDATQIQLTLSELLGVTSVSSFFGSSSTPVSTLKIVPDTRTNSLIVYGTANDINKVEQLLEVLDRDAPSSPAVSAPRIVPLRYASASSVARVVRDVYASRMATGSNSQFGGPGNFGGFSPFGSFGSSSGSSRSSSRNSTTNTVAIGVDEQSNSLVVSSSEAIYQEIRQLVETLDIAANTTQRTVSIVTVKNSTPSAVQDALNGLMGINTRTSSNSSSRSSSDSSRSSGGSPPFGGSMTVPSFGGFPGGQPPFGGSFFFRGGDDRGGFDRGRFDFGRGDGFRGDRRP